MQQHKSINIQKNSTNRSSLCIHIYPILAHCCTVADMSSAQLVHIANRNIT